MSPTVSVCMPTYNQARFLPEAIESVLGQTYRDFEFVIIDDHSTDASAEIIKKYAAADPRILFRTNDRNLGLVNNWNACLRLARGEYIKFLFGDDLLASSRALERMVSVLDADDEVALVSSPRYFIDERSAVINIVSDYMGTQRCDGAVAIMDSLIDQKNNIGEPSAVLFRKKHAARGFNPEYRQIVDLEMWFHILEQGMFVYLSEPLCSFRIHPDQETRRNFDRGLHIDDSSFLLRDYAHKPYLRFSRFQRAYMFFAPAYGIWNLYRKHRRISREAAEELIRGRYHFSMPAFFAFKPFFRFYKFYRRQRNVVLRRLRGRLRK